MPNGTLDSLNCILDPNEDLTVIFHGAALVFLRESHHNLATLLDLSIPCGNQFLNVLVFFSHDRTSLLSLLCRLLAAPIAGCAVKRVGMSALLPIGDIAPNRSSKNAKPRTGHSAIAVCLAQEQTYVYREYGPVGAG
jgi:hypothetical protein